MKKFLISNCLFLITIALAAQNNLPPEIKGNWMKANDSIEWIISFQPTFTVFDGQFWDYKSIKNGENNYQLEISNGEIQHQIDISKTDNDNLLISIDKRLHIICTLYKTLIPNFGSYKAEPFTEPLLTDDSVTIRGFVEDYDPELYEGTGNAQNLSTITRFNNKYDHNFIISPDGRFEVKFRAFSPQLIYITIARSTQTRIFMVPGEDQMIGFNKKLRNVTFDQRNWENLSDFEINHYMGHSGMLSEETLYLESFYRNKLISDFTKAANMELMPQLTYIRWRKQIYAFEIKSMDSLMTSLNTSERARQVMISELETDFLADIYSYQINIGMFKQYSPSFIDEMPLMDYNSYKYLFSKNYYTINNYMTMFNTLQDISTYKSQEATFMLNTYRSICQMALILQKSIILRMNFPI